MRISFAAFMKSEVLSTFAKIVAKAGNGATIALTEGESWVKVGSNEAPIPVLDAVITIPEIEGWRVIAKLDAAEGGNIVRSFSGIEVPKEYWHGTKCDHCEINRYRKESYLLQKDGAFKQVGSSCIADFTGRGFDHVFYREITGLVKDCEESLSGGRGGPRANNLLLALTVANAVVRVYGFVSSKQAFEGNHSTANRVWEWLNPKDGNARNRDERIVLDKVADSEEYIVPESVTSALAWARGLTSEDIGDSQYYHNLKIACTPGYLFDKNLGIVCSLLTAHTRMLGKLEAARAPKEAIVSEYQGKVKERKVFTLTLTKRLSFISDMWGTSFVYLFKDACGNVFKWATASDLDINVDDTMLIKGTVKEHSEYNEVKQTVLSRCKIEQVFQSAL